MVIDISLLCFLIYFISSTSRFLFNQKQSRTETKIVSTIGSCRSMIRSWIYWFIQISISLIPICIDFYFFLWFLLIFIDFLLIFNDFLLISYEHRSERGTLPCPYSAVWQPAIDSSTWVHARTINLLHNFHQNGILQKFHFFI